MPEQTRIASSIRSTPMPGDLGGELGLLPRHRHERDGAEVVDLVGLDLLHGGDQRALVEQVSADELDVRQKLAQTGDTRGLACPGPGPYTSYP